MKSDQTKKRLTLGEFVAGMYNACGKRKAKGIVCLAIKTHFVEFRSRQRSAVS